MCEWERPVEGRALLATLPVRRAMKAGERIALLGLSAIVAVSSALVVIALDSLDVLPFSSPPASPPKIQASLEKPIVPPQRVPVAQPRRALVPHIDPPPPPMSIFGSPNLSASVATATEDEEQAEWTSSTTVLEPDPSPQRRLAPPERQPGLSSAPPVAAPVGPSRRYSLIERLAEVSPGANRRLAAKFTSAKAAWPPAEVGLVAIKDQKVLELHARAPGGAWTFIHRYPVLAASGTSGPKLRHGDHQVPEGVYGIVYLNPNSRYHVSLRVNYPNAFDREMAAKEGRTNLGGDIMIHGKAASVGCLAIGDEASEEIFVLAAAVGQEKVKVVIAPTDFRRGSTVTAAEGRPAWVPRLYADIQTAMADFKPPPRNILLSLFGQ